MERCTLPRGATGFFRPKDGPLPETDLRVFRAALYAAARAAGGRVEVVRERAYPRTFHTAVVSDATGEHVILCHAHHPWIAFADELRDWYRDEFAEPTAWAEAFGDAGFTVLSRERLMTPLRGVDTTTLTRGEWREVRFYDVDVLGGVLFNAWD
ncbi:hypothetical protein [Streptomyces apocyni]|uniref:hypothetical protein n=1 Tax=Streptomyces apocyni TaxID=2654677 RepID=UPI0012EA2039|nr:hypothetical protein [Streptomyces apocyni]